MKKLLHKALIASLIAAMMIGPGQAQQTPPGSRDRVKDLTTIGGVRSNQLVGYGIVVGLNQTGDGNVAATNQTIQSMLQRFGMTVNPTDVNAKNTAAVMVTAELPPFAKPGQRIDVTVAAMGKCLLQQPWGAEGVAEPALQ